EALGERPVQNDHWRRTSAIGRRESASLEQRYPPCSEVIGVDEFQSGVRRGLIGWYDATFRPDVEIDHRIAERRGRAQRRHFDARQRRDAVSDALVLREILRLFHDLAQQIAAERQVE